MLYVRARSNRKHAQACLPPTVPCYSTFMAKPARGMCLIVCLPWASRCAPSSCLPPTTTTHTTSQSTASLWPSLSAVNLAAPHNQVPDPKGRQCLEYLVVLILFFCVFVMQHPHSLVSYPRSHACCCCQRSSVSSCCGDGLLPTRCR
jgi:hypothetical protein